MPIYNCQLCVYNTTYKSNYNRHLVSVNHIKKENEDNKKKEKKEKTQTILNSDKERERNYECPYCSKKFFHRQSVYEHKKICKSKDKITNLNITDKLNNEKDNSEVLNIYSNSDKKYICNIDGITYIINKIVMTPIVKPVEIINNDIIKINNINKDNKVSNKYCNTKDCKIIPVYNYKDEKDGLYCSLHKLENMINIKKRKCIIENCYNIPYYNYRGYKQTLYCSSHKLENMIDIKTKRCKTPLCETQVSDKYEGYCLFCFMNTFPDKSVSRNYKTKEKSVVDYVINQYPNISWISDKKIQDGCSRRRPDLFLDLGYQIIIIEIDENQHIDYDCSCENKRLMELSQDVGHRPIVFIRFNPDEYDDIKSCWGFDNRGINKVKKSKEKEWNERLNILSQTIDYWLENNTDKTIEVIQLFYDTS